MIGITTDQLMQEIERLSGQNPEGFTVAEMSLALERENTWCRKKIRQLMDAGFVRMNGRAKRTRIDGLPCYSPVYVFSKL